MSEKELVTQEISKEAKFDLKFVDGKFKLLVSYDGKGVDAGMYVDIEPSYFLDKVKEAIPGDIDDAIIDMLKLASKVA